MELIYDNNTRTTRSKEDIETRVPGWGDTSSVEYLDSNRKIGVYFGELCDFLVKELGYVRNKSLRGAPYDFRKAPSMEIFFLIVCVNQF